MQQGRVKPLTASCKPAVELSETRKYFCDLGISLKIESLGTLALHGSGEKDQSAPKGVITRDNKPSNSPHLRLRNEQAPRAHPSGTVAHAKTMGKLKKCPSLSLTLTRESLDASCYCFFNLWVSLMATGGAGWTKAPPQHHICPCSRVSAHLHQHLAPLKPPRALSRLWEIKHLQMSPEAETNNC